FPAFTGDGKGLSVIKWVIRSRSLPLSILSTNKCVEVFMNCGFLFKPCADFEIEGSFSERCCTIYTTTTHRPVAQVKRKWSATETML
ncbi:hypothetical protein KI387_033968, partial [Taxus chinensis]